jgi:carboxymethylenebutenolidase
MTDSKRLQHYIASGFIQIVVDDGYISAYWAHPQSGGPFPGLILLHDDRGLSPHMRHLVNRFAAAGYYVAAPDLFQGQLPGSMMEAQAVENYYMPTGVTKVNATLDALRSHHKCNSKMAMIGWDFGGTLAYHLAVEKTQVMAIVSFYGNPAHYLGHFGEVQIPVLAIFGEKDEIATRYENQLREELIRSGRPHEVIVYPEAQHGFYNDSLPSYNETAAEDAWVQTLAFLETHQGKPPAPAMHAFEPGRVY